MGLLAAAAMVGALYAPPSMAATTKVKFFGYELNTFNTTAMEKFYAESHPELKINSSDVKLTEKLLASSEVTPEKYFSFLVDHLSDIITSHSSEYLTGADELNVFMVPEFYFKDRGGRPFSEEVVKHFVWSDALLNATPSSQEAAAAFVKKLQPTSLAGINLLVVPGTVWWWEYAPQNTDVTYFHAAPTADEKALETAGTQLLRNCADKVRFTCENDAIKDLRTFEVENKTTNKTYTFKGRLIGIVENAKPLEKTYAIITKDMTWIPYKKVVRKDQIEIVIHNSSPVFFGGKRLHVYAKHNLSHIDGIGKNGTNRAVIEWDTGKVVGGYDSGAKLTSVAKALGKYPTDLSDQEIETALYAGWAKANSDLWDKKVESILPLFDADNVGQDGKPTAPVFTVTLKGGKTIKVGLEVCLDHNKKYLVSVHKTKDLDVQLLTACGMGKENDSVMVRKHGLFFRVDGHSNAGGITASLNDGTKITDKAVTDNLNVSSKRKVLASGGGKQERIAILEMDLAD